MDTLPLPPRPDLEQYKKRAKDLVAAARSKEPGALRAWARDWLEALARLRAVELTPFVQSSLERATDALERGVEEQRARGREAELSLADAQFLIARAHGFESWSEFAEHVRGLRLGEGDVDLFEAAADAVVDGELTKLEALLRQHPQLIRARSTRKHGVTLLHYVAANGVEDFRQRTPPNAVAIAKCLLDAGAEVDALANTYGGDSAQTTLNLLVSSVHPDAAGLQVALTELLLDHGAALDGLERNGSPLMTALAFGYGDTAEAIERRGARIDNLPAAAALGRVDLVRAFLGGSSPMPTSLGGLDWIGLSSDPRSHRERALVWASAFGRAEAVELLLAHGVDVAATDPHAMTALHWAAANGYGRVVEILLAHGAPLEAENAWSGTVLGGTLHFARQYPQYAEHYAAIVERLLEAGANPLAVRHPTGIAAIDAVFRRRGIAGG